MRKQFFAIFFSLVILSGCSNNLDNIKPSSDSKSVSTIVQATSTTKIENTSTTIKRSSDLSTSEIEEKLNSACTINDLKTMFKPELIKKEKEDESVPVPPQNIFKKIEYTSPIGKLSAYISPDPGDEKKHPAIIWKAGGFSNSIGEFLWKDAPKDNDQSAAELRKAGIILMAPSLRGGNKNPGYKECFLGEVDDVIAAAEYLSKQDYVDPKRIYLGGHSTGGTLVLLAAESSDKFRAVFSFGPVASVASYPEEYLAFDKNNRLEKAVRAPAAWLNSIKNPTYIFEGVNGNYRELHIFEEMKKSLRSDRCSIFAVKGADHFSTLYPLTKMLSQKILEDTGDSPNIQISDTDIVKAMGLK